MRWVLFAALVIAPAIAAAAPAPQSNPAFLGVVFSDMPGSGCMIEQATALGAAAEAGVEAGDLVIAIDLQPLIPASPCQQMVAAIVGHQPGDRIRLEIRRGDRTIAVSATLTTRAEVLQKRVGQRMEPTNLIDTEDTRHTFDLGERRGQTTVIGWFTTPCSGCATLFDRVTDRLHKRIHGTIPQVLAVQTYEPSPLGDHDMPKELAQLRKDFASSVPLAVADSKTVEALAMLDRDRVFFMVIDCRGIIQLVAPVAPDADDLDAGLDEVLAAAEQAEHARTSRR